MWNLPTFAYPNGERGIFIHTAHMKLLYIIPFIPYPLETGGNQAFFTITDYVRKQHEVSVILYVRSSKDEKNIEELRKLWSDVTFHVFRPQDIQSENDDSSAFFSHDRVSWLFSKFGRWFGAMHDSMTRKVERRRRRFAITATEAGQKDGVDFVRSNASLFLPTSDFTPQFCQYVEEVSRKGFDLIQVEFYDYLPMIHLFPKGVKTVFVHHELRFVRNENEMSLFKKIRPEDRLLFEKEKALELSYLAQYDAVVTLTDIDKQILSQHIPAERIFVSPAITQSAAHEHKPFRLATELVFIGSGYHFPNADAMVWFCKEVLPIVRKKYPKRFKVNILSQWNRHLMSSLTSLAPEIVFPGYMDDLQSFVNGKVSIVPIRIGSGMRMKILDSIFAASPIVTTSKGCEGLPLADNENCLIADDKEAFADAVVRMLTDPSLQERLAVAAQHSDTGMLDEQEMFDKRMNVYKSLVS